MGGKDYDYNFNGYDVNNIYDSSYDGASLGLSDESSNGSFNGFFDGNGDQTGLVPYVGTENTAETGDDGDGREFLTLEIKMRKMRNRVRRRYVAMILVSFVFAFILIFRYSLVIEINESIVRERGVLDGIQNANSLMQKEINQEMDLEKVRLLAEVRLGMQKPDKHQIVYIKVPKKDHAVVGLSGFSADSRFQNPFDYVVEQARLMQEKLFSTETTEAGDTVDDEG